MTRYRLYAHRHSYAMTTHLLLEELAVDYDIVWCNVHKPDQIPPELLHLNPQRIETFIRCSEGHCQQQKGKFLH